MTMIDDNTRWLQRFDNFKKALIQLTKAVNIHNKKGLSHLEQQGIIQGFEYTHELAWNTIKDFFKSKGNESIFGSRDATKEAFSYGLINYGDTWMEMIKSRNLSTHTYNQEVADKIVQLIVNDYYNLFLTFEKRMEELSNI